MKIFKKNREKKHLEITLQDVALILSVLNLLFILFCEFVLK